MKVKRGIIDQRYRCTKSDIIICNWIGAICVDDKDRPGVGYKEIKLGIKNF
jgi:hypothetical protein